MSETLELGELPNGHLSATSIEMFRRCPQQYAFRYMDGIKRPPPGAIIVGTSVHKGLETDMTQKIITKENMTTEEVKEVASDAFDKAVKEAGERAGGVDWEDAEPGREKDSALSVLGHYHAAVAVGIQPVESESAFEISFAESKATLVGRIDTISDKKEIIDFKTSKMYKKSIESTAQHPVPFQLKVYQLARPDAEKLRLDYMLKNKTAPDTATVVYDKLPQDQIDHTLLEIQKVTTAIKTGIFYTNPGFQYLNCKLCGYREMCPLWKGRAISS